MTRLGIGIALMSIVLGNGTVAWGDATTSPGKTAVYVSAIGAALDNGAGFNISGTIQKGKKKRVLEVDLMATDGTGANPAVGVLPTVNGVAMEPNGSFFAVADCNAGYICTVSSHWWIDLDAAETANPGMFINQPLNIVGNVISNASTSTADVSLRARMQKK